MEDILYKRQSDETIGACIEVHKLRDQILAKKFMKPALSKVEGGVCR